MQSFKNWRKMKCTTCTFNVKGFCRYGPPTANPPIGRVQYPDVAGGCPACFKYEER